MGVADLHHHSRSIGVMTCGVPMNFRSFPVSPVPGLGVAALLTITMMLSGFKIVTSEQLAEIRNVGKAPAVDGASLLRDDIIPWAVSEAHDINQVSSAIDSEGFMAACETYGVQKSQAFPCSFWVHASGTVTAVDTSSRVGKLHLAGASGRKLVVLTGPVIPGSSLRDGYPDINYSDFGDQNVYASLSDDINKEVISIVEQTGEFSVGDQLSVVGAYSSWDGMEKTPEIVPVAFDQEGGK